MTLIKQLLCLAILMLPITLLAQEKRNFMFKKLKIPYYVYSHMTESYSQYPNHWAKIIIINSNEILDDFSIHFKSKTATYSGRNDTLYYFLKLPKFENTTETLMSLEHMIKDSYHKDYFDRNTLVLDLSNCETSFDCDDLNFLNSYASKIIVPENSEMLDCNKPFVTINSETDRTDYRTSITYESSTLKEAIRGRKNYNTLKEIGDWKGNVFITTSLGNYSLDNAYRTEFDEETLVDISEKKSIWHFGAGYMLSSKFGGFVNIGFMSSQEQTIDINGSNISGTGNGFGLLKFGVGIKYIPFTKDKWSIYSDVSGGGLSIKAGGGSGSLSGQSDFTEKSIKSNYISFAVGTNYRLGKLVFLTANFDYTFSNFESDIGSISGFTGYTINFGIGVSFK